MLKTIHKAKKPYKNRKKDYWNSQETYFYVSIKIVINIHFILHNENVYQSQIFRHLSANHVNKHEWFYWHKSSNKYRTISTHISIFSFVLRTVNKLFSQNIKPKINKNNFNNTAGM